MAISKIIIDGVTKMDVTSDTVEASNLLSGYTALKNDGTDITGTASAGPTVLVDSVTINNSQIGITFSNISSIPSFFIVINSTTNTSNKSQPVCVSYMNTSTSPNPTSCWGIATKISGLTQSFQYVTTFTVSTSEDGLDIYSSLGSLFYPGTYIIYYIM